MKKHSLSAVLIGNLSLFSIAGIGCGTPEMMNMPPPVGSADSKFRPNPNGFKFANDFSMMAPSPGPTMTTEEVRRFFGDQVCATMMGGCVLTPAAKEWLDAQNKELYSGLCEGFAVLANMLYIGANGMKASDFQAGAQSVYELNVADNGKLQRELAYWFTSQLLIQRPGGLTPSELGTQLLAALAKAPSSELPTIAFFKKNGKDGHAMNAHAISATADGYNVKIYDNNYPNEEKELIINTKADTWVYRGSTTAMGQMDEYLGDTASKSISLVPTALRLGKFPCTFCGDVQAGTMPMGVRQVKLNSRGHVLIQDAGGKRLGYAGGTFVNEITGGEIKRILNGTRGRPDPEPLYSLPGGSDLTLSIDGAELTAASNSTVSLFGPGYTLEVDGINLEPGQKDTLAISAMGNSIVYTTLQSETPTLVLGIQTAADDYSFEVRVTGDSNGQVVTLILDQATGKLKLQVDGHDTADYDIDLILHRIGSKGDEVFSHVGDQAINIASGGSVNINYGTWTGQGGMVSLEVDNDRNGSVDRTVMLTDQN